MSAVILLQIFPLLLPLPSQSTQRFFSFCFSFAVVVFEASCQWCMWFQKIFQPINCWFRSGGILFCIMWHFFFCFTHRSSCHPDWCWTCGNLPSCICRVLESWVCLATPKTLTFFHLHAWDEYQDQFSYFSAPPFVLLCRFPQLCLPIVSIDFFF